MPDTSPPAIPPLTDWLIHQALMGPPLDRLIPAVADRLREADLPVAHMHLATNILHPQFDAVSFAWWDDTPVLALTHHADPESDDFLSSPYYPLIQGAQERLQLADDPDHPWENAVLHRRLRLEQGEGLEAHPLLVDIAARGMTDYLACIIGLGTDGQMTDRPQGIVMSWSTRRPGGFTDADIVTLIRLVPALGTAVRTGLDGAIARSVVSTYLGEDAGGRVLAGNIHRGQLESVRAAILYGDLRGFTAVSDVWHGGEVVGLLDRLFEAMAEPVLTRGGQVMKFMGDAILATFALEEEAEAPVCAAALDAAIEAQAAVDAVNRQHLAAGKPAMPLDQALHLGTVMYGNVGTKARLDFTVIGPAVNEAARMESLCQRLDVPITVSGSFVDAAATPERFRPLGHQTLRGVGEPLQIFTIAQS